MMLFVQFYEPVLFFPPVSLILAALLRCQKWMRRLNRGLVITIQLIGLEEKEK